MSQINQSKGTELRVRMREAGITQQQLADRLGVSQSAVAAWGQKGVPPARGPDIARILGCESTDITHIGEALLPLLVQNNENYHSSDPAQQSIIDLLSEDRLSRSDLDLLRHLVLRLMS